MEIPAKDRPLEKLRWRDCAGLLPLGLYIVLSVSFFGRLVLRGLGKFIIGGNPDVTLFMWSLVWWPYAFAHRLNVFMPRIIWAPAGVNLAWVTAIPAPAISAAPLTHVLGPIATYNILCLIQFPLAGWAAFLLCRNLTDRYWPSVLGGYVFGFSSYMLGKVLGQLFELIVFPVPIVALLVMLLAERRISRILFVIVTGVVLAFQFWTGLETFATMTSFGIAALIVAFVAGPEEWRDAIRRAAIPIMLSYGLLAILASPYIYYLFAFGFPRGPLASPKAFSIDLLNFVLPTPNHLLGTNSFCAAMARRFPNREEASAYLALPLIAIVAFFVHSRWNSPVGKFLTIMLGAIAIASLGPRLHIAGHVLIGMPWKLFELLPLIKSALPSRFPLYLFLIVAVVTAIWISDARTSAGVRAAMAAAIVVLTLPNLDSNFWAIPDDSPAFFTTAIHRKYLAPGENVVVIPYGVCGNSMLWQAETGMYFRMAGGHTGPTLSDDFIQWPAVNALHFETALPDTAEQLKGFLGAHQVSAIVIAASEPPWWKPIIETLGIAPTEVGGVLLYRVPAADLDPYRGADLRRLESKFNHTRFTALLVAAERYLEAGGDLSSLTPRRVEQLGLLPDHWTVGTEIYTKNGLWLGRYDRNAIGVGVVGSYEAVKPLIDEFGPEARAVYFPYPHPLHGPPQGNTFMRKLVMVFEREGLRRAAARAEPRAVAMTDTTSRIASSSAHAGTFLPAGAARSARVLLSVSASDSVPDRI